MIAIKEFWAAIRRGYINPDEQREATRHLPRLMFEGLLLGGSGLGVLALIFEIAADAFSVAAYQTLARDLRCGRLPQHRLHRLRPPLRDAVLRRGACL